MASSEAIGALFPLTRSFEYAAEIGLALRMHLPDAFADFEAGVEGQRTAALAQAQGFAFLSYLEKELGTKLIPLLEPVLEHGAPRLKEELLASLDCLEERPPLLADPGEALDLGGEPVVVVSNQGVRAHQSLLGIASGLWTQLALARTDIDFIEAPPCQKEDLLRAHRPAYIDGILGLSQSGGACLTPETAISRESEHAILGSAGSLISGSSKALELADEAVRGARRPLILCQASPGSHHAERSRGGGTCLVNNLAVAALWAHRKRRAGRLAILDVDAHHGNGTEEIFYESDKVLVTSLHHALPFFPGTGARGDRGRGLGQGLNFNFEIEPGGRQAWRESLERSLREIKRFRPGLVLVELSADAHQADPVGQIGLLDEDFELLGRSLARLRLPVVCELGSSTTERAWIGALRGTLRGWGQIVGRKTG